MIPIIIPSRSRFIISSLFTLFLLLTSSLHSKNMCKRIIALEERMNSEYENCNIQGPRVSFTVNGIIYYQEIEDVISNILIDEVFLQYFNVKYEVLNSSDNLKMMTWCSQHGYWEKSNSRMKLPKTLFNGHGYGNKYLPLIKKREEEYKIYNDLVTKATGTNLTQEVHEKIKSIFKTTLKNLTPGKIIFLDSILQHNDIVLTKNKMEREAREELLAKREFDSVYSGIRQGRMISDYNYGELLVSRTQGAVLDSLRFDFFKRICRQYVSCNELNTVPGFSIHRIMSDIRSDLNNIKADNHPPSFSKWHNCKDALDSLKIASLESELPKIELRISESETTSEVETYVKSINRFLFNSSENPEVFHKIDSFAEERKNEIIRKNYLLKARMDSINAILKNTPLIANGFFEEKCCHNSYYGFKSYQKEFTRIYLGIFDSIENIENYKSKVLGILAALYFVHGKELQGTLINRKISILETRGSEVYFTKNYTYIKNKPDIEYIKGQFKIEENFNEYFPRGYNIDLPSYNWGESMGMQFFGSYAFQSPQAQQLYTNLYHSLKCCYTNK